MSTGVLQFDKRFQRNVNFCSGLDDRNFRSFEVAATTLVNPRAVGTSAADSSCVIQGEFLAFNAAGALTRVGANQASQATATGNVRLVYSVRGDSDAQMLYKVACPHLMQYEIETTVFDPTASYAPGDALWAKYFAKSTVDGWSSSYDLTAQSGPRCLLTVWVNPTGADTGTVSGTDYITANSGLLQRECIIGHVVSFDSVNKILKARISRT